jgi:hypothetical protein
VNLLLNLQINARGFLPDGGGSVMFTSPVKKNLRPVQFSKPGKICKVRGIAYVCKVSPSIASRMVYLLYKISKNVFKLIVFNFCLNITSFHLIFELQIESAKKMLRGYIADAYITIDQRKGPQGGM